VELESIFRDGRPVFLGLDHAGEAGSIVVALATMDDQGQVTIALHSEHFGRRPIAGEIARLTRGVNIANRLELPQSLLSAKQALAELVRIGRARGCDRSAPLAAILAFAAMQGASPQPREIDALIA
jgi:hypothetical protein